jgi:peptide deformylase
MAVRAVLRLGDPSLRLRAQPVADVTDPLVRQLIVDLDDTMRACSGAGLAAPQIGVPCGWCCSAAAASTRATRGSMARASPWIDAWTASTPG